MRAPYDPAGDHLARRSSRLMPLLLATGAVLLFGASIVACSPRPVVFDPLPSTRTPGEREVVVQVRPIDTRLGSDDRRRFDVDIGAYFAAFLVAVENRTAHDVAVDLAPSTLGDPVESGGAVLTDDEMVRTYRRGGMNESAMELIAKAPAVVKREVEHLRAARMPATQLGPGERVEGVLFFRPLAASGCDPSMLTIRGIEILDELQQLEFQFPLTPCGPDPERSGSRP